jgi:hypothetical protein
VNFETLFRLISCIRVVNEPTKQHTLFESCGNIREEPGLFQMTDGGGNI